MMRKLWLMLTAAILVAVMLAVAGCSGNTDGPGGNVTGPDDDGYTGNGVYTRVNADGKPTSRGRYILFGSYPQSRVEDDALTDALNAKAGELPTAEDSRAWTSYEYYLDGEKKDYMWYVDVSHDNAKYRGVYFTSYRPIKAGAESVAAGVQQPSNGYASKQVYWFLYEPILWKIGSEGDGQATLVADLILDSQAFNDVRDNDYTESTIRDFLTEMFYETAFDQQARAIVEKTSVETGDETTQDKVFLPNHKEAAGFFDDCNDRRLTVTEYARVQGVYAYQGTGWWWLRNAASGENSSDTHVEIVYNDGILGEPNPTYDDEGNTDDIPLRYADIYSTRIGVCPAVTIKLS